MDSFAASPRLAVDRRLLGLLLLVHTVVLCVSSSWAINSFPGVLEYDSSHLLPAILNVSIFALVTVLFVYAQFSFGYVVSFYFYTMIAGYLWLIEFSLLSYHHRLAQISIVLSGLAFVLPALFITSPIRHRFVMSANTFDKLLSLILFLGTATVAVGAVYNFRLIGLSEIYIYRAEIEFPAPVRYAIGISSNALLPFAFACFVDRKFYWRAGISLALLLLLYPITLTKLTLFAPLWLLFLALLSRLTHARTATILSLLLPMLIGIILFLLTRAGAIPSGYGLLYAGIVNGRLIAMPSVALEVYNNFFSEHVLTYFCQVKVSKLVMTCPYDEPLSVVMSKAYQLGAFNASLFATEGIASLGPTLAPLSAFGCGLVIALANRVSSGLSPRFILLSAGLLPHVLLNVPLSTTLLTNGAALLFLLWYVAPRAAMTAPRQPPEH
ncbi:hypothetical protein [Bradyrhizobium sp. B117]|uniref:hypothetical protein n=1 Tax=Bradyrhizobium sp. B117 TaxID=3140246 RepID=UPI003183297D